MAGTEIRRATLADVPDCARIIWTWIAETDWMPEDVTEEQLEGLIREAFPNRDIWVSGDPVDCYMSVDPVESKVGALYCLRTGQGIGKQLLDQAKTDRDHLWLTTHVPNVAAQRFYCREGFVETGREAPVPPDTVPVIRMEWRA